MEKQLLTIKEFAEIVGITQQAVYKQLNNKLNNYVVSVEKKKMLKYQALFDVYGIDGLKTINQVKQPVEQQFNQIEQPVENQIQQAMQQTIDILKAQIAEKDKQIAELQKSLADAHKITDQQQQLQLLSIKQIEPVTGQTEPQEEQQTQTNQENRQTETEPIKKGGFLQRFFKL